MNFSSKHKLQRLLALLYGLARAIICHVITWLILLSFNDQTYLLSSVEFLDVQIQFRSSSHPETQRSSANTSGH